MQRTAWNLTLSRLSPQRRLPALLTLSWQCPGILVFGNLQGHLLQKAISAALTLARGKAHTCSQHRLDSGASGHVLFGSPPPDVYSIQSGCAPHVSHFSETGGSGSAGHIHLAPMMSHTEVHSASVIHPNLLFGCDFNPAEKTQEWSKGHPGSLCPD